MKIDLYSSDDGKTITWKAVVSSTGRRSVVMCRIEAPYGRAFTNRDGAINAGLYALRRMFPEVEITAHRVKE